MQGGPLLLSIPSGSVTIISGPNGVGKSALLHQIYRMIPEGASSYYPGHRQITFNSGLDNMGMDLVQLSRNLWNGHDAFSRYKGNWGEDHIKSIMKKLQNSEASYNQDIVERFRIGDSSAPKHAKQRQSPFYKINAIFSMAGLPIRLRIDTLGIMANRYGSEYRIDQLSDGERAALFLVGAVLTQEPGSIILLDEPERHLHPSISAPLIESTVRSRSDIAYVFSTHDLSIIESIPNASVLHVTDSRVDNPRPETRSFMVNPITIIEGSPEELKTDVLGVRRDVLFIEGDLSSLDIELYSRFYPDWKIIPKGGWEQCVSSVRSLSRNSGFHWLNAAALIDADGRDPSEQAALKRDKVHTLPFPTVENVFVLEGVVTGVASALYALEGGQTVEQRLAIARERVSAAISSHIEEIVARRTVWLVNRSIAESKISVDDVRSGKSEIEPIDIGHIKERIRSELSEVLSSNDVLEVLRLIPIKNSPIPHVLSASIGAVDFNTYKSIVLKQLDSTSMYGKRIRKAITRVLPKV
jgi:energy-coupling factor transporter ATP-binding protein EcfA2